MSKKTAVGLLEAGRKIKEYHPDLDWETFECSLGYEALGEKHNLHEADWAVIKTGFSRAESPNVPDPDDLFPFGNMKGKPYHSIPPEYYEWFWKQEWKKDWQQVVNYIKAYAPIIKKAKLDKEQKKSEEQELIDSLTDL